MLVELVYDKDCPNVARARTALMRSFAVTGLPAKWTEWQESDTAAPGHVRGFGSPTVLINRRDVAGVPPMNGLMCCRLYEAANGTWLGAPVSELIVQALQRAMSSAATSYVPGGYQGHFPQRGLINSGELRRKEKKMNNKRRIEIFSAGCPVCEETIALVNRISCPSCEVEVLDMRQPDVALKAKKYGIQSVPGVVIDGKLAECCVGRGPEESSLRAGGLGVPIP